MFRPPVVTLNMDGADLHSQRHPLSPPAGEGDAKQPRPTLRSPPRSPPPAAALQLSEPPISPPPSPQPPRAAAPPRLELGNTPSDSFRIVEDDEGRPLPLHGGGPPLEPRETRVRLVLGLLLLGAGIVAMSIGADEGKPGLVVVGVLALVPGAYIAALVCAVYALRRREHYNALYY